MNELLKFLRCETGTTSMEYGLIAFLIITLIFAAVTAVGNNLFIIFNRILAELQAAI